MTYYLKDVNGKVRAYSNLDDARKTAYMMVDKGIRKSVTIKIGKAIKGRVYAAGLGIVYRGETTPYGFYINEKKTWVILPDGTISHEYDGSW